jgi:hypothetical protein
MEGDVSIRYQVKRDILDVNPEEIDEERARIHQEGWGKRILEKRDSLTKLWGGGIYSPKFISTHYTLLQLKNMGLLPEILEYQESAILLMDTIWLYPDGKVNNYFHQDMCVVAMILSIVTYGRIQSLKISEMVDYIWAISFLTVGGTAFGNGEPSKVRFIPPCRWWKASGTMKIMVILTALKK